MTQEDWQRLKSLFTEAMDLPAEGRGPFMDDRCGDSPELRAELAALLEHHEQATDFLEDPVRDLGVSLSLAVPGPMDERIGHYRLLREIDRGGMGTVYLAERADAQYEQRVAIKIIKRGMDTNEVYRRFLEERQILARLAHPNIARLLDGGVTDDGRPYFVMEFIEGVPITRYCRDHGLGTAARVELFRSVCAAVHFAHQNLIIHRDLKPSNILVTEDGSVKLLDFGIAKVLSTEGESLTLLTEGAGQLLTPAYASPEQVRRETLTTASDIYSLGVLLYVLLSGTRPYDTTGRSPSEVERLVCEQRPTRPSVAAGQADGKLEEAGPIDRRNVSRRLRGDLDTIVMVALRKEPSRRYGSAEQLAEDLRLHLQGHPVSAREEGWTYRTGKFVRRHPLGTAAAVAFVALIAAGGIVMTAQSVRIAGERDRATAISNLLIDVFQSSDPRITGADTVTARDLLDRGVSRVQELEGRDDVKAALLDVMGLAYHSLGLYDQAAPLMEESLALKNDLYGPSHPETATSLNNLGNLLQVRGRLDEAEPLLRQALAIREATLPPASAELAQSLNNLSQLYLARRDFEASEPLLLRSVEIHRQLSDEAHPDLAQGLNNLGLLYHLQGRYAEAVPYYRESLAMQRAVLGTPHPDVAQTTNNLGLLLQALGDYDGAEPLYRESLEMRRALLGDEHPRIVVGLNNVALLLFEKGDYAAAGPLYEEALALGRRTIGAEHPQIAVLLNNLGDVQRVQGDFSGARERYEASLEIRLRLLGPDHPHVAYSLNGLALLSRAEGDLAAADSLFRAAAELRRRALGDRHPDLAVSLEGWADLEAERGRSQEAESLYAEALDIRRAALPEGHPLIAETEVGLGTLWIGTGRGAEAEPLLVDALEIRMRVFGDGHPRTVEVEQALSAYRAALAQ